MGQGEAEEVFNRFDAKDLDTDPPGKGLHPQDPHPLFLSNSEGICKEGPIMGLSRIDGHEHYVKRIEIKGPEKDGRLSMSRHPDKSDQSILLCPLKGPDRPIRPEDEPLMVKFHETLSERSVYFRYFHAMRLTQRVAHERLTRICFIDYEREMALVRARKPIRQKPDAERIRDVIEEQLPAPDVEIGAVVVGLVLEVVERSQREEVAVLEMPIGFDP